VVVVVFRSRIRPELAEDFERLADRMFELCRAMPGFRSYKVYQNDDGERVSIHEWETAEHLRAWREQPEHRAAQALGRERYYAEYTSYVMETPREARFTSTPIESAEAIIP
jgi:heme-degrading monooxygenase HmoA